MSSRVEPAYYVISQGEITSEMAPELSIDPALGRSQAMGVLPWYRRIIGELIQAGESARRDLYLSEGQSGQESRDTEAQTSRSLPFAEDFHDPKPHDVTVTIDDRSGNGLLTLTSVRKFVGEGPNASIIDSVGVIESDDTGGTFSVLDLTPAGKNASWFSAYDLIVGGVPRSRNGLPAPVEGEPYTDAFVDSSMRALYQSAADKVRSAILDAPSQIALAR